MNTDFFKKEDTVLLEKLRREVEQLRVREAQYRALFDLMPGSVLLLDAQGLVRDANPTFRRQMGYTRLELLGERVSRFTQDSRAAIETNLARVVAGEVLEHEVVNIQKNGRLRYYELREAAVTLPDGTRGVLAMSNDITARKVEEHQREQLILQLQQTLAQVRELRSLLPVCAACKKARDDKGYWNQIESYITNHSRVLITASLCPDCAVEAQGAGSQKS